MGNSVLQLHRPHFKCSSATCGWWLTHQTAQIIEYFHRLRKWSWRNAGLQARNFFPRCLLHFFSPIKVFLEKRKDRKLGGTVILLYTSLARKHRLTEKELTQSWLELGFFPDATLLYLSPKNMNHVGVCVLGSICHWRLRQGVLSFSAFSSREITFSSNIWQRMLSEKCLGSSGLEWKKALSAKAWKGFEKAHTWIFAIFKENVNEHDHIKLSNICVLNNNNHSRKYYIQRAHFLTQSFLNSIKVLKSHSWRLKKKPSMTYSRNVCGLPRLSSHDSMNCLWLVSPMTTVTKTMARDICMLHFYFTAVYTTRSSNEGFLSRSLFCHPSPWLRWLGELTSSILQHQQSEIAHIPVVLDAFYQLLTKHNVRDSLQLWRGNDSWSHLLMNSWASFTIRSHRLHHLESEASGNRGQEKTWHLPWTQPEESSQFCICQIMLLRNLGSLGMEPKELDEPEVPLISVLSIAFRVKNDFCCWKLLCESSLSPLKKIQWSPIEKSWTYNPGLLSPAPCLHHPDQPFYSLCIQPVRFGCLLQPQLWITK